MGEGSDGAAQNGEGILQVFLSEELGWRQCSRSESLWRAPRTHAHDSRTRSLTHTLAAADITTVLYSATYLLRRVRGGETTDLGAGFYDGDA